MSVKHEILPHRHASEIWRVWFQTAEIKWILQWSESHEFFGFPLHIKVMFILYCYSIKYAIALCLKNNVHTLIKNNTVGTMVLTDWPNWGLSDTFHLFKKKKAILRHNEMRYACLWKHMVLCSKERIHNAGRFWITQDHPPLYFTTPVSSGTQQW